MNRLPNVTFKIRSQNEFETGEMCYLEGDKAWMSISSSDLFSEKRVLIFSLPGAFTPTCSSQQLPAFDEKFEAFKNLGIDEVFCISVNDSYVMNAWSNYMGVKNVQMIPDGTGQFTRMMGMLINKDHNGFGMRSWRYMAVINDGVVEKWWQEPGINNEGLDDDPYFESTPKNVIDYLRNN